MKRTKEALDRLTERVKELQSKYDRDNPNIYVQKEFENNYWAYDEVLTLLETEKEYLEESKK